VLRTVQQSGKFPEANEHSLKESSRGGVFRICERFSDIFQDTRGACSEIGKHPMEIRRGQPTTATRKMCVRATQGAISGLRPMGKRSFHLPGQGESHEALPHPEMCQRHFWDSLHFTED